MQVVETKSEGLSREMKVTVAAKDIEEKINLRLEEVARSAALPGFRPGKVPLGLLRKRFGPAIMGEILDQAVNDSSAQALAEKGLRPATQPQVEITSFDEGKDLEYTLAVDVLPEITPMDFSKLKVEKLVLQPDETQVQETLENLANAHKTSEPITSKRKSKSGDVLVIDFVGKLDGVEFAGGKAEGYHLELGSGSFIPGFEDQLIGAEAGTDIEVKVNFPEEYAAKDLAGKEAVFDVKVHEIREAAPAPIDDELAKKAGLESLEALKERIVEGQRREFDQMARMQVKRDLLDQLADNHEFEMPPTMVEMEFENIWAQFEEQRKQEQAAGHHHEHDHDHDHDHHHHGDDKSDEEHQAEFREIAERRVKLGLLLSEVGRSNAIQVGPEDVNRAMMREAQKYPGQEQQVLEFFRSNPQAQEQIKAPVFEEKVIDYILELAQVTEKPATFEDLIKALEEEDEPEDAKKTTSKKKAAPKKAAKADDGGAEDKKPAKKPAAKKE
ncbi:MAG: trigger factor [Rhodospirillales bacterium CG15_BIG_FIL_POST_REV_8_21_14_020_66_15]|nr:MAG: trigger factor [Rhodospirillales bacterium CG15_BIG_FIL_POST_REV_8_21_14_020_66_15]